MKSKAYILFATVCMSFASYASEQDARDACAKFFSNQPEISNAESTLSTDGNVTLRWTRSKDGQEMNCTFDAKAGALSSVSAGPHVISGEILSDMIRKRAMNEKAAQGDYSEFITVAKSNITRSLKDPGAAQFRDLYISKEKTMPVLCGEINGKNSYGACIGFRKFYATSEPMLQDILDPSDSFVFDGMYKSLCSHKVQSID